MRVGGRSRRRGRGRRGSRRLVCGLATGRPRPAITGGSWSGSTCGMLRFSSASTGRLVIARIVEPTSLLDIDRVLAEMGRGSASLSTRKRTLRRCYQGGLPRPDRDCLLQPRRDQRRCVVVLYDVTTLYFEAEKEDDLRKVGYSKERRVDPQSRRWACWSTATGFPLEIGCFEGNKAETAHDLPIIKAVPGAPRAWPTWSSSPTPGCCPRANLSELDEAGPAVHRRLPGRPRRRSDLESHFRWHGDAFIDGQVIDTITPKNQRGTIENRPEGQGRTGLGPRSSIRRSWRAVWAYSTKRAVRDNKTLTLQENRARAVVAGREDRPDAAVRQDHQRRHGRSTRPRSRGHAGWSG